MNMIAAMLMLLGSPALDYMVRMLCIVCAVDEVVHTISLIKLCVCAKSCLLYQVLIWLLQIIYDQFCSLHGPYKHFSLC